MSEYFSDIVDEILEKNDEDVSSKYVYHYTSGVALKSIIEKDQLWLSDRNYMNDVLDEKYVKRMIKSKFSTFKDFKGSLLEELLLKERPQYIFSTSLEPDLIHQWSYYRGSDSYSIEFDRRKLRDFFQGHKIKNDMVHYGRVIYQRQKQRAIINQVSDNVMNKLSLYVSPEGHNPKTHKEMETAKLVYEFFYSMIKQEGHSCENEYRYLFHSAREPEFELKTGLFVPTLKLGKKGEKLPINRIILGPSNHESLSSRSLRKFLDLNMYDKVGIGKSGLNVRA